MTFVDWIAAGTKVSAERILRRSPFQTCSVVSTGVEPGGLIRAVKATLLDILASVREVLNWIVEVGIRWE